MTSRDAVFNAVKFLGMPRLPMGNGTGAYSDVAGIGYKAAADFRPEREGENEWGCAWKSLNAEEGDQGQVAFHPLGDWEKSGTYRFPDPFAPGRLEGVTSRIAELKEKQLFVIGSLGKGPMHLLDDLRGFENYLMDMLAAPENIDFMLDGIFKFLNGMVLQYAELGVDAVWLADDQAMQSGPLFSMDIWREKLKPRYKELCKSAHEKGPLVFMHACGNLSQHLEDLSDAGIDLLDNKQPALWMDSPAVDAVRGRLAFSTCIDIQSVMQSIETERIEAEVSRLIRRLALPSGGFVGACYSKPDLQLPREKVERMLKAFKDFRW